MNSPVTPQSTRAEIDFFSAVSVVSISTFNFNEVGFSSVAAMTNFWGRDLSHFGQQVWTEEVTDGSASIHDVFDKKVADEALPSMTQCSRYQAFAHLDF